MNLKYYPDAEQLSKNSGSTRAHFQRTAMFGMNGRHKALADGHFQFPHPHQLEKVEY
jgi:hypothetical protein